MRRVEVSPGWEWLEEGLDAHVRTKECALSSCSQGIRDVLVIAPCSVSLLTNPTHLEVQHQNRVTVCSQRAKLTGALGITPRTSASLHQLHYDTLLNINLLDIGRASGCPTF